MIENLTIPDDYRPQDLIGLRQPMTQEEFEQLCRKYRKMRLELTSTGELIIMPPSGYQSDVRNVNLTYQLGAWSRKDRSGICSGSSTIFAFQNGAWRSPDAAWVKREKWESLTAEQREGFARFCPDFVVEIRSPSDRLTPLRNKMAEYMENGVSLGWLIDPFKRRVYVYEPHREVVILDNPKTVSGDPLLPGFTLNLAELW